MERSNLIKIGTKYLTSDGTSTGLRCLTEIENLHLLIPENIGPVIAAMSGRPHKFFRPNTGEGVALQIRTQQMATARRDEIISELDISSGTVDVTISGPSGDFHLLVYPADVPLKHGGKTRTGRVYDVEIDLVVASVVV